MTRDDDTITERTLTVTIECNSAAFDGADCGPELARILRGIADELEGEDEEFTAYDATLYDINGNRCGDAEMTATDYRR